MKQPGMTHTYLRSLYLLLILFRVWWERRTAFSIDYMILFHDQLLTSASCVPPMNTASLFFIGKRFYLLQV